MANQLRTFTGGLDTDTAPHLMKEDTYSSAMNVHVALNQVLSSELGVPFNNDRANEGILNMFAGNLDLSDQLNTTIVNAYPSYNSDFVSCVGYAVDEAIGLKNERYIYLFLRQGHNAVDAQDSDNCFIVKGIITFNPVYQYNTISSWEVLLMGTMVDEPNIYGDGLQFFYNTNLVARITGNLLIFTDNSNPVRYVDTSIDYFTYTTPITQNLITLAVEPPIVPLTAGRQYVNGAGVIIFTGDPLFGTIVQKQNYQFTYRVTNTSNLVSVLSPYTFNVPAARQQDIDVDPFVGNRITVIVEKTQKFSEDTKVIDIVSRLIPDSKFDIIHQWNIEDQTVKTYSLYGVSYTDAQAIAAHNDPGNPFQLYVNGWDGTNVLERLDDATANKPFDSLPIRSYTLETAANRLFLGNNLEGYNIPAGLPAITPIDVTTYLYSNSPTVHPNSFNAYCIILGENSPATKWSFCIYIMDMTTGKNYSFPKSFLTYGQVDRTTFTPPNLGSHWSNQVVRNLPKSLSFNQLILLNEQGDATLGTAAALTSRKRIMDELNPLANTSNVANANNYIWFYFDDVTTQSFNTVIYNDAPYSLSTTYPQVFMPNSSYNIGIQFYDGLFRKSGVKKLGSFSVPQYNPNTQDLLQRASFFMPGGPQTDDVIPPWAKYYAITQSKNSKASNFVSFSPTALSFAYKTPTGEIVYNQSEVSTNYKYYGLAIPLSTINAYGVGYTFAEGDICELNVYDSVTSTTNNFTVPVLNSQDGYAIVLIDKDLVFNYLSYITNTIQLRNPTGTTFVAPAVNILQKDFYVTLYTPQDSPNLLYEVSAFGPINGPAGLLEFGNFFPNFFFGGSLECQLIGDNYTQARNGCGSMIGTSMNTYEKGVTTWPTNLGRATPIDLIGQKLLSNSIRWSNVKIPNSNQNGLASFDALNEKSIDANSGAITSLMLTTKESNLGSRMLILARSGSYLALLGQQQIYGQDQQTAFVAYADVMGSITPITGGWGCISPKSVVTYHGITFWADALNKEIIQLTGEEATPISQKGAAYLWNQVFSKLDYLSGNLFNPSIAYSIRAGICPYTFELFVTCPSSPVSRADYGADCGYNNINQYVPDQNLSYVYNYKTQTWQGAYQQNPDEWVRVGDDLYSTGKMYTPTGSASQYKFLLEFVNPSGEYNQFNSFVPGAEPIEAWVTFPMNKAYPQTIEPLSLSVLDASAIKNVIVYDRTYSTNIVYSSYGVGGYGQIARTENSVFQFREGEWILPIYRNRFSNNAGETGFVTQIVITTGGSGYTSVPNVTIGPPPPGGTQATAYAVTNGISVTNIIITNPGSGYTMGNPPVIIDPPASVGVQATAYSVVGILNSFDQAGITGDRIRCKTPFVQITMGEFGTPQVRKQLNMQSVKLEYKQSTGH